MVSVAKSIKERLEIGYFSAAGPSLDGHASDQPDVAARDVH